MIGRWFQFFDTIIITLIIGFMADYVLHMTLGYARSKHNLRKQRTRDALREVGISITSGFFTSVMSCFPMFFAVSSFFITFAKAVFGTLGFAYFFSIVVLPAILSLIGPQHCFGSIKPLCKKCCPCCCSS